jgi:hypothetical protein
MSLMAHETTAFGATAPQGGRWAASARAIVREDGLSVALRLDRAGGRRPVVGVVAILHDVPATELRTLATALLELATTVEQP